MIVHHPGLNSWEVGKWKDGVLYGFASSEHSNENVYFNKAAAKERRQELFSALGEFTKAAVAVTALVMDIKNASSSSGSSIDATGGNVPSGKSQSYYQAQYNQWETKAKNAYGDRVRHKSSAKTYRDGQVASSDAKLLRQYQSYMRKIRATAKKEGFIIPQSEVETWSF